MTITRDDKRLMEIIRHKARTVGFHWNNFSPKRINNLAKKMLRDGELEVIGGKPGDFILMRKQQ